MVDCRTARASAAWAMHLRGDGGTTAVVAEEREEAATGWAPARCCDDQCTRECSSMDCASWLHSSGCSVATYSATRGEMSG